MWDVKIFNMSVITWVLIVIAIIYFIFFYTVESSKDVAVEEIKSEKFTDVNSKIKVFNFNTEWCGYSKRFQPEWDKFQAKVNSDMESVAIAVDIKCDQKENEPLCAQYKIEGFPTVIYEKNGAKHLYDGERTVYSLTSYLNRLL